MRSGPFDYPERDPRLGRAEFVLGVLRALPEPLCELPDSLKSDSDKLADILFDHRDQIVGPHLLYYMSELLLPQLDEIAADVCTQELWFLSPEKIAEDAVGRLYTQLIAGARTKPWIAWAWRVVGEVIRLGLDDPALQIFEPDAKNSARSQISIELARRSNRLPIVHRRVAWMAWVMGQSEREIAVATHLSLEKVEWILSSMLDAAMESVLKIKLNNSPFVPGSTAFWDEMERTSKESDNGSNGKLRDGDSRDSKDDGKNRGEEPDEDEDDDHFEA